jgi:LmbE family N-acetylglucosaminyl deacetylase
MKRVLVVAPHPDDETLGCGGALLRHKHQGDELFWLIGTEIAENYGFTAEQVSKRVAEIKKVSMRYGFTSVCCLELPTTKLDTFAIGDIVGKISEYMNKVLPEIVYLPFWGDIHTDHKIIFEAAASCTKWFRYQSVQRVLCYETLSETEFCVNPCIQHFAPNVYVNISEYLDRKIEIANIYTSEIGEFPFPRSEKAIRALAELRGAACGFQAAEAFMLLKEVV